MKIRADKARRNRAMNGLTEHEDATMSAILTDDEVKELTGHSQKSKQIQTLQAYNVRFFKRPDGKPVVPVAALSSALNLPANDRYNTDDTGFNLEIA